MPIDEQAIRERAYAIWEQEGCPDGSDVRHWFLAEAEYLAAGVIATEALKAYLKTVVLPMIIIAPDGSPQPVGTASIVACVGRQILVLTARHNIDHIKKVDQPYGDRSHTSMPEFFRTELRKDHHIENTDCYLLFPFRGGDYYSPMNAAVYKPEFDIALASCILPDNISPPNPLSIDTNPPQIDMQGFAVGYASMKARAVQLDDKERAGHWEFEGTFSLEPCRVIAALPAGASLYRGPCFQIDTPIHSGMSGGPVINFPDHEHPAICGILTSDELTNLLVQTEASGAAAIAAALWISVALSMWIARGDGPNEEWTLLDLIRNGIVNDFGTANFELRATDDGRIDVIPKV